MKKVLVLTAVALMGAVGSVSAQRGVNESALTQALAKAQAAAQDAKKNTKSATWITLGQANYDATTAPTSQLFRGMDEATLNLVVGKGGAPEAVVIEGVEFQKIPYDYLDVYMKDGAVSFWKEKKTINDGGLEKALEAFRKAAELDKSATTTKKITEEVTKVYNAYKQIGDNNYTQRDMKKAAEAFGKAYDVTKYGLISVQDTTSGYNAGLIYAIVGEYSKADNYLSKALADGLKKGGDTYYYLNLCYAGEGKSAQGKQMLLDGIKEFPTNTKLVEGLLNVYANTGEDPNTIIPYVMDAIAKDPGNPELYAGLGRVYDKLGDLTKSVEAFEKALALAPEDFGTNFNLGLMIIKEGDVANNVFKDKPFTSKQAYDADVAAINGIYAKALPVLEKAHSLKPADVSTVELLKNLYFRLRDESDAMMSNYKKYNEMLESMR